MGCRKTTQSECTPLQVVLYEPEIPQNAGNVARTCAATRIPLHFIKPLGFYLTDRYLKRAGLDYWPHVDLHIHEDMDEFRRSVTNGREVYFSAHGTRVFHDFEFAPGDILVFGPETRGLPGELLAGAAERTLWLPIDHQVVRSLNLATTVGVVVFEAIRQLRVHHNVGLDWINVQVEDAIAEYQAC